MQQKPPHTPAVGPLAVAVAVHLASPPTPACVPHVVCWRAAIIDIDCCGVARRAAVWCGASENAEVQARLLKRKDDDELTIESRLNNYLAKVESVVALLRTDAAADRKASPRPPPRPMPSRAVLTPSGAPRGLGTAERACSSQFGSAGEHAGCGPQRRGGFARYCGHGGGHAGGAAAQESLGEDDGAESARET